ncbi:hypothetical protein KC316_g4564 [Hortaea werneckii]|nr:hypothetical protein KC324_g4715 [Hortaea werneckii]KAI7588269.1 hypothetical protein KC316_g4564 [Hortaea werneckii]
MATNVYVNGWSGSLFSGGGGGGGRHKGAKCNRCKRYGHIRRDCPTYAGQPIPPGNAPTPPGYAPSPSGIAPHNAR